MTEKEVIKNGEGENYNYSISYGNNFIGLNDG